LIRCIPKDDEMMSALRVAAGSKSCVIIARVYISPCTTSRMKLIRALALLRLSSPTGPLDTVVECRICAASSSLVRTSVGSEGSMRKSARV
jgi:hypothetical protein